MFTKVMKGLPKRIAAFVMAVLMLFSLMPIDPSVVLAEGRYTYTFVVKDNSETDAKGLSNATIVLYKTADKEECVDASTYTFEAVTTDGESGEGDEEQVESVEGKYILTSSENLSDYYYVINVDGYKCSAKTQLGTLEEGATEYVVLEEKTAVELSFSNITSGEPIQLVVRNTFAPELVFIPALEGVDLDGLVTYEKTSGPDDVVNVDAATGVVTAGNSPSDEAVTITVEFAGNEEYASTSATFQVKVVDKTAQNISFDYSNLTSEGITVESEQDKVTYTTNFIGKVIDVAIGSDKENPTFSYLIKNTEGTESADVVKLNAEGKLEIVGAGTAIVTVTEAGDATYASATKTLTVVVEKLSPNISFEQNDFYDDETGKYLVTSGEQNFILPGLSKADEANGEIIYSIQGDNVVITESNTFAEDGSFVFTNKTGEVTIRASYAEDTTHKGDYVEYTIKVEYLPLDGVEIKVNDETPVADSWKNDAVTVTVPDGYEFCTDIENPDWKVATETYTHVLAVDGEQNVLENQAVILYVKNSKGYIGQFTYTYKYDAEAAGVSAITNDTKNLKDAIMDFFSFVFGEEIADEDKKVTIDTIIVADGADVNKVYYFIQEDLTEIDPAVATLNWIEIEDISDVDNSDDDLDLKLDIMSAGEKVIYVKVEDEAGNISYASTDGIVFDATEPVVEDIVLEGTSVDTTKGVYYTGNVTVKTTVKEVDVVSGIKSIKYVITSGNGAKETEKTFFTADEVDAETTIDDLIDEKAVEFVVDATAHNADDVKVVITVEDNAGNVTEVEKELRISVTEPTITVGSMDADTHSVQVIVTSRSDVFDENGLVVAAKATANKTTVNAVKDTHFTIAWADGTSNDEKIATITFTADAAYSDVVINYTDKVGKTVTDDVTVTDFIVDTEEPTGTINIADNEWYEKFFEKITFSLWSKNEVEVTIKANDNVDENPIIEYIKVSASDIKTLDELEAVTDWNEYSSVVEIPDETSNLGNDTFVIYAKITDDAGLIKYISSNGYIVDMKKDGDDSIAITFPTNGLEIYSIGEKTYECYRDDVTLAITAKDDAAGIKKVIYKVGKKDELANLEATELYSYSYDKEIGVIENKLNNSSIVSKDENTNLSMEFQDTIIIFADEYNYDNVVVWVELTDNAGNVTTETTTLNILKEKCGVDVFYEPVDASNTADELDYFKVFRTANVTINSRESIFNADGVEIKVLDDKNQPVDESLYSVEYNEDYTFGDTHSFTINFTGNAKYNFSIEYTDAIKETAVHGVDTFVVDRDLPTATIKVDKTEWMKFFEKITFGLWSSSEVTVTATGSDATSPVTVEYVLLENVNIISKEELAKREDWTKMPDSGVSLSDNNAYIICVKVTDNAGNVDYFSSDGFIVDEDNAGDQISVETNAEKTNGYYCADVPVQITVAEDGAGIKKVTYKIVKDDDIANATEVTLYEYIYEEATRIGKENKSNSAEVTKDTITGLAEGFKDTIPVVGEDFNSKNVYVVVTLTDNAGNKTTQRLDTPIAVETPEMEVSYVNDTQIKGTDDNQIPHYQAERQAKIMITSRDDLFDKDNVKIVVTPTKGENLENAYSITWDDDTPSGTHIAYVTFSENAKYEFTVNYENKVGVAVDEYATTFVIDDVKPNVEIIVGEEPWYAELLEKITFGFWKSQLEVLANYSDVTSQIKSIEYIKTDNITTLTESQLDEIGWQEYKDSVKVSLDETLVVYVKVTDCAGNYRIISSKGIIVDTTEKVDITLAPTIQSTNGYYNEDIPVDVIVKDKWDGMTSYSGIKEVVYWVESDGVVTQKEKVLYQFTKTEPTYDDLVPELVFDNEEVLIDADKNNSDKVVLYVKAADNAGNSWTEELTVKIDSIQPKIEVDYEDAKEVTVLNGYGLYDATRKATVVITERASCFDDAKATDGIEIVVADAMENELSSDNYTVSDWTHTGSGDTATHTATVLFNGDGYYNVKVGYTDVAGNVNKEVVSTTSENPYKFVVDTINADVKMIADAPDITCENDSHTNAIYTDDFNVVLKVDDGVTTSGLQKVEYWIKNGDTETKKENLYIFDSDAAVIELEQLLSETLLVDSKANNSCNIVLHVIVTDNVGRTVEKELTFDIDIDKPIVSVNFDNNSPKTTVDGKDYYVEDRTATIIVDKRAAHFDADVFKAGLVITAVNADGRKVDAAYTITEDHDGDIYTYVIKFSKDANYTFDISAYTDKAGLNSETVETNDFVIDRLEPTGTITVSNLGFWKELLKTITFGLWSPSDVDIVITGDDATSPIKSVQYFKTSTFTALSWDDLEAVTNWVDADSFTVSTDDIFVVYAKIVDYAGNVEYISTNGIILDDTEPVFETLSPEITLTPERPVNGIYDGNVRVDVGVVDPIIGDNSAYAGLRTIIYEVYNMGVKSQEGILYDFEEKYPEGNPTHEQLRQSWNEQDIVVEAAKNNSNDVLVKVIATDNAGNQSVATTTLKIDITAPKIEVSYDNNNGDATFADGVYYNANRVATIKVTERNFDSNAVNVVITNTDGAVPTISKWTTKAGTGNGDDTVYTATIVYAEDGDYTFAISAKDKVGNANEAVTYGNSQAPTAFSIDKTVPVISVVYDNNDFANDNYYKADRTATITINEHNFDASRVVATITATDNGQTVTAPTISNWSKSGDTYTATVSYSTDALYTFDIAYSDKAKNQAVDFAEQSFYVDKTIPQLSITEIVDQSANNKDKVGFVITATDTNFDVFNPVLTAVVKTENGFITQELNIASISDITNGRVYTISNIDADGIYRITCTLVDKAGNAYTEVTLHQADGTPYVESRNAEDTLLTFSVNRDGSVFEVDEATKEILDNYYVHDVTEDIVIIEVNANRLTTNNVTLNGKELIEGTDFTVSTEGGNGAWLRYIYTLNKELFVEEGEYTIVVSSVDEAENNAFSDVKNAKVAFVVDRTAPVVTISGLETNGKYQTENQKVTLIPTDDGGEVKSIVVNQVDEEGNVVKTLLEELSGEALTDALAANDGQISFNIPSGEYDYIEIVCADCSVNAEGDTNTAEILIKNVLITESELELIWATYQYAIIAGVVAVIAVPTGIVLFRRRVKAK